MEVTERHCGIEAIGRTGNAVSTTRSPRRSYAGSRSKQRVVKRLGYPLTDPCPFDILSKRPWLEGIECNSMNYDVAARRRSDPLPASAKQAEKTCRSVSSYWPAGGINE